MAIYKEIRRQQQIMKSDERRAMSPRTDPRIAHDAEVSAARAGREIERLAAAAKEGEMTLELLRRSRDRLRASEFSSRERSCALTRIEEAEMWIQRELGTAE